MPNTNIHIHNGHGLAVPDHVAKTLYTPTDTLRQRVAQHINAQDQQGAFDLLYAAYLSATAAYLRSIGLEGALTDMREADLRFFTKSGIADACARKQALVGRSGLRLPPGNIAPDAWTDTHSLVHWAYAGVLEVALEHAGGTIPQGTVALMAANGVLKQALAWNAPFSYAHAVSIESIRRLTRAYLAYLDTLDDGRAVARVMWGISQVSLYGAVLLGTRRMTLRDFERLMGIAPEAPPVNSPAHHTGSQPNTTPLTNLATEVETWQVALPLFIAAYGSHGDFYRSLWIAQGIATWLTSRPPEALSVAMMLTLASARRDFAIGFMAGLYPAAVADEHWRKAFDALAHIASGWAAFMVKPSGDNLTARVDGLAGALAQQPWLAALAMIGAAWGKTQRKTKALLATAARAAIDGVVAQGVGSPLGMLRLDILRLALGASRGQQFNLQRLLPHVEQRIKQHPALNAPSEWWVNILIATEGELQAAYSQCCPDVFPAPRVEDDGGGAHDATTHSPGGTGDGTQADASTAPAESVSPMDYALERLPADSAEMFLALGFLREAAELFGQQDFARQLLGKEDVSWATFSVLYAALDNAGIPPYDDECKTYFVSSEDNADDFVPDLHPMLYPFMEKLHRAEASRVSPQQAVRRLFGRGTRNRRDTQEGEGRARPAPTVQDERTSSDRPSTPPPAGHGVSRNDRTLPRPSRGAVTGVLRGVLPYRRGMPSDSGERAAANADAADNVVVLSETAWLQQYQRYLRVEGDAIVIMLPDHDDQATLHRMACSAPPRFQEALRTHVLKRLALGQPVHPALIRALLSGDCSRHQPPPTE